MSRNATHAEVARVAESIRDEIEVQDVWRFIHNEKGALIGRQYGMVKYGTDGKAIIDWSGIIPMEAAKNESANHS